MIWSDLAAVVVVVAVVARAGCERGVGCMRRSWLTLCGRGVCLEDMYGRWEVLLSTSVGECAYFALWIPQESSTS